MTLDEYIPLAVPLWKVKQAQSLYENTTLSCNALVSSMAYNRDLLLPCGVECNFGAFTGNFRVIDALSTLAYEGRRQEFFRKDPMAALQILEQRHIEPEAMKGSWAGAMGQCQFMPSSF